jgi:hypothetical protein
MLRQLCTWLRTWLPWSTAPARAALKAPPPKQRIPSICLRTTTSPERFEPGPSFRLYRQGPDGIIRCSLCESRLYIRGKPCHVQDPFRLTDLPPGSVALCPTCGVWTWFPEGTTAKEWLYHSAGRKLHYYSSPPHLVVARFVPESGLYEPILRLRACSAVQIAEDYWVTHRGWHISLTPHGLLIERDSYSPELVSLPPTERQETRQLLLTALQGRSVPARQVAHA